MAYGKISSNVNIANHLQMENCWVSVHLQIYSYGNIRGPETPVNSVPVLKIIIIFCKNYFKAVNTKIGWLIVMIAGVWHSTRYISDCRRPPPTEEAQAVDEEAPAVGEEEHLRVLYLIHKKCTNFDHFLFIVLGCVV
jgi:hypothetical protein